MGLAAYNIEPDSKKHQFDIQKKATKTTAEVPFSCGSDLFAGSKSYYSPRKLASDSKWRAVWKRSCSGGFAHPTRAVAYRINSQQALEWVESTVCRLFFAEVSSVIGDLRRMKPKDSEAGEEIRKQIYIPYTAEAFRCLVDKRNRQWDASYSLCGL